MVVEDGARGRADLDLAVAWWRRGAGAWLDGRASLDGRPAAREPDRASTEPALVGRAREQEELARLFEGAARGEPTCSRAWTRRARRASVG